MPIRDNFADETTRIMFSHYEEEAKKRGYHVDKNGYAYNKHNRKVGTCGCDGYKYFAFRDSENKIVKIMIHRMQAFQKYGKRIYEEGIQVRHLDGNRSNNSRKNIAIGTALDNYYDKPYKERSKVLENFLKVASEFHTKYTDDVLAQIKKRRNEGATYTDLMNEFGISSKGTISYIVKKRIPRISVIGNIPV